MNPEIVALVGLGLLASALIAVALGSIIRWGEGRQRRRQDMDKFMREASIFTKKQAD